MIPADDELLRIYTEQNNEPFLTDYPQPLII